MARSLTKGQRRSIMASIRSKDTKPALIPILNAQPFSRRKSSLYRVHGDNVPRERIEATV
jgi:hypothetical protein